ncbi:MAG: glycoside hydrolase family 2 TIM barrel-domain containing protein [Bacteroidales bacterium]|nr:glycoside hydrolase family 2 TIM barrel-domain containing protein [Bacteroidales bacterium]MDD4822293.1 glycoside hydrolase family 2 TIM barrel-domain containing protein [Bacteroidales bacterium]
MKKRRTLFVVVCVFLATFVSFGQDWSMKSAKLMTPFAATIDTSNVLGEYPRPQMVRQNWMNLNGIWQFQPGTSATEGLPAKPLSGKILVPFPVESAISGVMQHYERLWYRRTFTVPSTWDGQRILVHFGAVDYESEVFINGHTLGIHKGGYDPFSFDITPYLTGTGPQELTVRVYDPTSNGGQPRGKQSLTPGGIMYTCTSGIWQSVWLEPVPQTAISNIRIVPDIDKSLLNLTVTTEGSATNQSITAVVKEGDVVVTTFEGAANSKLQIPVPNAKLWTPDSPFLYDLSITLNSEGAGIDSLTSYFGMRKISVGTVDGYKKLLLNNEFLFQIGPLDQGFWPDGLYTAPTDSALRYDIEKMKEFGFNMVRKHIKVEPYRWYYWADKLGLMVWQDMPSPNSYIDNPPAIDTLEFHTELRKMIETHWNCPSIIMWVLFNEGQGQHNTENYAKEVKAMDPSRIVNEASGWNLYGSGEVKDYHNYPAPSAPSSTTQALACGEYGGIAYSVNKHIWGPGFGYTKVYTSNALANLYDVYANDVTQFKTNNGMSAAVYTQITDVEIELNGLLTYDRAVTKADPKRIFESNSKIINKELFLTNVLPIAPESATMWKYTTSTPSSGWNTTSFNDSSWRSGQAGFGTANTPGTTVRTVWNTSDIWIRKQFSLGALPGSLVDSLLLYLHHDEACEVYINGVLATSLTGYTTGYSTLSLSANAKSALLPNASNVIAIHCNQVTGGQYIDAGLALRTFQKDPFLGLSEVSLNRYSIFSNLSHDTLFINGLDSDDASATIYDAKGSVVNQKSGRFSSIDVSSLSEGIYTLQINDRNEIHSFKFVR